MNSHTQLCRDYQRIEQAIYYLSSNVQDQPSLQDMAKAVGLSEFHFQRTFKRWSGVTPKRFLQFLTKEYAKSLIRNSNVLDVSLDVGLSSPSRLHDLFIQTEAVTPGEYKRLGQGLTIAYGIHPTPFGRGLIALTHRGICHLSFNEDDKKALSELKGAWPKATLTLNQNKTQKEMQKIFASNLSDPIKLYLKGTNFQIKVWEALLKIPSGQAVTYKTIATHIGKPTAMRAVGSAIGRNPIAYLIPCHRVIQSAGALGGYRWGVLRKQALLGKEALLKSSP